MQRINPPVYRWYCTGRVRATSLAALVTILLHLVIAVPMLVHTGTSSPRSSVASPLVFVGLLAPEEGVRRPQSMPRWFALSPPSSADIDDIALPSHVEVPDEVAEPAGPVPDFVRRIGIITAQIQGAWSLPAIRQTRDFHCQVRLREDEAGVLRAIELRPCDDDPELRESLLKAIRASAPPPLEGDSQPIRELTLSFAAYASLTAGRRSSVEPSATMP
jgi:hypothetical protein